MLNIKLNHISCTWDEYMTQYLHTHNSYNYMHIGIYTRLIILYLYPSNNLHKLSRSIAGQMWDKGKIDLSYQRNYSNSVLIYVTGFWKTSPNVTFHSSKYSQNEQREFPITFILVSICSSHLKLCTTKKWEILWKFCNIFTDVIINCAILCISMWHLRLIFQN